MSIGLLWEVGKLDSLALYQVHQAQHSNSESSEASVRKEQPFINSTNGNLRNYRYVPTGSYIPNIFQQKWSGSSSLPGRLGMDRRVKTTFFV